MKNANNNNSFIKNKKILFVVDHIFPDSTGGSKKHIFNVACQFKNSFQYEVTILCTRPDKSLPSSEIINNVNFIRLSISEKSSYHKLFSSFISVRRFLKDNQGWLDQFDTVVFSHLYLPYFIVRNCNPQKQKLIYLIFAVAGKEYEVDFNYKFPNCSKLRKIWFFLNKRKLFYIEKSIVKQCHDMVSLSQFVIDDYVKTHNVPKTNFYVIGCGVDPEKFVPANNKNEIRNKLEIDSQDFVLFTARRLEPRMGLLNLLKSIVIIRKNIPKVRLVIAGDGGLRSQLEDYITKNDLTNIVTMTGDLRGAKLINHFQMADIFVLPTKFLEGFGLIILESFACNVPVVGTPVGAIPETLEKFDKRLLTDDITPQAIARKVIEVHNNYDNFLKNYRQIVLQQYTWKYVAMSLKKVIDEN